MSFSFSFTGNDIEEDVATATATLATNKTNTTTTTTAAAAASAFPVQGKPLLPPTRHSLSQLLATLPSRISYSLLHLKIEGREEPVRLPRRELWDVRLQLMAEDEGGDAEELKSGLGNHDVKTGIYEGGFKSWESSVDLVKVLAEEEVPLDKGLWVIEMGCGTALPSLALFQWALAARQSTKAPPAPPAPLHLTLADYNPGVLHLVTLPNLLLIWALHTRASSPKLEAAFTHFDGELQITEPLLANFTSDLAAASITFSFLSGGWSSEFVDLLYASRVASGTGGTLVLGAETIYSPLSLALFTDTLLKILRRDAKDGEGAAAVIAAKRLYFAVGGSLDDFVERMRALGARVEMVREVTEGVRRGVVKCNLP